MPSWMRFASPSARFAPSRRRGSVLELGEHALLTINSGVGYGSRHFEVSDQAEQ